MSNFLFHNKFHQANHHTIATPGLPDSATDPIASLSEPFQGVFYNYQNALLDLSAINVSYLKAFIVTNAITTFDGLSVNTIQSIYAAITANVFTNSEQWFKMHTNINTLSAVYGLYPTVSTTVNTNSANWNRGFNFYSSLRTLSTNYFSTYTVVNANSANWPFIDTTLRLNLAQQNTHSKNFSGVNITSLNVNAFGVSAFWNLSAAQCAFFRLTADTVVKNILNTGNKKKGGEYVLVLQQDGYGSHDVVFDSDYVFPVQYFIPTITYNSYGTGINSDGQLGVGSTSNKNTFTALTGDWSQIVCGGAFTMAQSGVTRPASTTSSLSTTKWFSTGSNAFGELGLSDNSFRTRFTALTGDWSQIVCGVYHTMALSAGTTKWFGTGSNAFGELGLGDNSNKNRFIALTGDWSQMVCKLYSTLALSADNITWFGTGSNGSGELGLGDNSDKNRFTALTGNWSRMINDKGSFTMAQSAGTTKWFGTGSNIYGQLGLGDNGSLTNRNRFTALTGDWSQMVCGSLHTMAQSAGTTKWFGTGYNGEGQLGLGDNSFRTRFTALTGDWSQMVCGISHTLALSAGTTKWFGTGQNTSGQLGLGNNSNTNRFTALTGDWSRLIAGGDHTMAQYVATTYTNVVAPTALSVTVIRFTCDGTKLYGKPTPYYYERDTIWTYFAGPGLIFTPSPAEFYINDYFIPINGLTVAGVVVPAQGYSNGGGITVVEGLQS